MEDRVKKLIIEALEKAGYEVWVDEIGIITAIDDDIPDGVSIKVETLT